MEHSISHTLLFRSGPQDWNEADTQKTMASGFPKSIIPRERCLGSQAF